jgi:hypothetical protein
MPVTDDGLYHLPRCREVLPSAGVPDDLPDDADTDADAAATDSAAGQGVAQPWPASAPPKLPDAEPVWRAVAARGDNKLASIRHEPDGLGVTVGMTFANGGLRRPRVTPALAALDDAAMQAARELPDVRLWLAARAEVEQHRRAAAVADAEVKAVEARRAVVLATGGGEALAKTLKALDDEQAKMRAKAIDANELLTYAEVAERDRRGRAKTAVAEARRTVLLRRVEALRERQRQIVFEITEASAGRLDELVATAAELDSIGPLIFARDVGDAEQLMGRLGRGPMQEANAQPKVKAAAAPA